jgi:hypothetical protein
MIPSDHIEAQTKLPAVVAVLSVTQTK